MLTLALDGFTPTDVANGTLFLIFLQAIALKVANLCEVIPQIIRK